VLYGVLLLIALASIAQVAIVIEPNGVVEVSMTVYLTNGLNAIPLPVNPIVSTIVVNESGKLLVPVFQNNTLYIFASKSGYANISYVANITVSNSEFSLFINASYVYKLVISKNIVLLTLPKNVVNVSYISGCLILWLKGPQEISYVVRSVSTTTSTTVRSTVTVSTTTTTPSKTVTTITTSTTTTSTPTTTSAPSVTTTTKTIPTTTTVSTSTSTAITSPISAVITSTSSATTTRTTSTIKPSTTTTSYISRATSATTTSFRIPTKTTKTTSVITTTLTSFSKSFSTTAKKSATRTSSVVTSTRTYTASIPTAVSRSTASSTVSRIAPVRSLLTWIIMGIIAGSIAGIGIGLAIKKRSSAQAQYLQSTELSPLDRDIINAIAANGGTILQSELQKKLGIPKTTLWRHLRKLEKLGLIKIVKEGGYNKVVLLKK